MRKYKKEKNINVEAIKNESLELLEYVQSHPDDKEEIIKRRRILLRKYAEFYESNSNKLKQQHFIIFMDEKLNSEEEIKASKNNSTKIAKLIKEFREEKTNEEKYLEVSSLFEKPEKLLNTYYDIIVPLINYPFLLEIHNIYKFYKDIEESKKKPVIEKNKNQELITYLEEVKEYVKYYDYARFVINMYIEDEKGYMFDEFLESIGINRKIFNYCIKVINELDVDLYRKYEKKHKENIIRKYMTYKEIFESIINGIKTGYLIDKTPFDLVEFWKNIPFINCEVAVEEFREFKTIDEELEIRAPGYLQKIINFVKATTPEEQPTIRQFIAENKLGKNIERISLEKLNEYKSIVNDKEITEEDNKKIINYMTNNDIPLIKNAYVAVRTKYINDELDLNKKTTRKTKKKTLIP